MTTARRKRKRCRLWTGTGAAFAAALMAGVRALPAAATSERIVVDWHTGLAIGGYDPVAFFTDGKAIAGGADFELRSGGVIWRFRNPGNRAAFAARPDIYMPQYGGYDPLGVAEGVAVAGNPNVWMLSGERLFLFYDRARSGQFAADPDRVSASADRKWPDVQRLLTP